MEITKIGKFTDAEVDALSSAGSILGSVAKAIEAGDITVLEEESKALISALKDVLARIK